jgi:hypothetical protein
VGCAAGGILAGDGIWRHHWEIAAVGVGLLTASTAGLLAAVLWHLLRAFEHRTRQDMGRVEQQRRSLDAEMRVREDDLARREAALDRRAHTSALRIEGYKRCVDDARTRMSEIVAENDRLMQELSEVTDERNQLVVEEMLAAAGRFTSRGYGRSHVAASSSSWQVIPQRTRRAELQPVRNLDA